MLKGMNRFYNKIAQLIYRKGYLIDFSRLEKNPTFDDYDLNDIGNWLSTKGDQWLCTSKITNKEEFAEDFFEKTQLPQEKIKIEEKYYPQLSR